MGIHGSKEHGLNIAKTLQTENKKKPPKCLTTGVFRIFRSKWMGLHSHSKNERVGKSIPI